MAQVHAVGDALTMAHCLCAVFNRLVITEKRVERLQWTFGCLRSLFSSIHAV